MASSIRSNAYRWLTAMFAVALVLGLLVGSNQNTAQAIDPGETDIAYVADGYNFPDALMGATLAGLNTAPMLGVRSPTTGDVVPPETAAELDRLTNDKASPLATIYVFGGSAAVSDKVVGELEAWANNVERIFGADRFGTMKAISEALPSKARDSDLLDGMDSTDFASNTHDHRETVTRHVTCSLAGFLPQFHTSDGRGYWSDVSTNLGGESVRYRPVVGGSPEPTLDCSVDIPTGAEITELVVNVVDRDGTEDVNDCALFKYPLSGGNAGAESEIATTAGTTGSTDDVIVLSTNTITDATVSGPSAHSIRCDLDVSTNVGVIGGYVTYQVVDVATTTP